MIAPHRNPKCYGYGRISKSKGELHLREYTYEAQEQRCQEMLTRYIQPYHEGVEWGGFFFDDGVSAKHGVLTRPAAGRLITHVAKKGDWIVTPALDRMFRLTKDAAILLELITEKLSCRIMFGNLTGMDFNTPEGRLMFNVFASLGQFEREQLSRRTQAAMDYRAQRGHPVGKPGYGNMLRNHKVVADMAARLKANAVRRDYLKLQSYEKVAWKHKLPSKRTAHKMVKAAEAGFPYNKYGWRVDEHGRRWCEAPPADG